MIEAPLQPLDGDLAPLPTEAEGPRARDWRSESASVPRISALGVKARASDRVRELLPLVEAQNGHGVENPGLGKPLSSKTETNKPARSEIRTRLLISFIKSLNPFELPPLRSTAVGSTRKFRLDRWAAFCLATD